ncbi:phosphoenolpyruvate hydrolase family protein [Anaeroselena agilis]|uniref:Phosphoenolpyruvate hydrolase family protein n=1 Tax=Anaeroselena agilis TaxID=3063788 RepID=A0ABU3NSS3_9FIRM|nr:phosphoenolpyruvate hydrolase family protein [Selenomonadales bacterium 4137-cl]
MKAREDIRKSLAENRTENQPIIGVAVGSGLSAKQAIAGGADFLLALNAGRFRMAGISSLAALLPYANSNEMVLDFGSREIIPRAGNSPVIFGACATDVTVDQDALIAKIRARGFQGVNNFPTVGLIDGSLRQALEEGGLGFEREVEFIAKAAKAGLFTVAFVFDEHQGQAMAAAGADIICAHLGLTVGGKTGAKHSISLEKGIKLANGIFATVDSRHPAPIKMIYGGPVSTPEQTAYFYGNTGAVGYIGGSSFERIPAETTIEKVTGQFKNYMRLKRENESLRRKLLKKKVFDEIVGQSRIMQELFEIVSKVADKNVNVLVCGESGTGKELVVRAIHYNSPRNSQPFIKVNCASIPDTLLESELFGHEKGSFTGATRKRVGLFELANRGTLFLDEVSEMSPGTQAKLLRAIQQQEFLRIGGSEPIKVDTRIICATNADLHAAVAQGKFREDLFYRINVVTIRTPPLRQHKEDIPLLVNYFLEKIRVKFNRDIRRLSAAALDALMQYHWPGNVRELEHVLESAAILCDGDVIDDCDLPISPSGRIAVSGANGDNVVNLPRTATASLERQIILGTLNQHAWHRQKTAQFLGITRRTLLNKMKKYGIRERDSFDG